MKVLSELGFPVPPEVELGVSPVAVRVLSISGGKHGLLVERRDRS